MSTAEASSKIDDYTLAKWNSRAAFGLGVGMIITTMMLASCKTKLSKAEQQIIDTPIICQVFERIVPVESDSAKTKKQADVHNAVWDHYCKTEVDHD